MDVARSSNEASSSSSSYSSLAVTLLGDVLVAVSVTAVAAPFLVVIDKALVQRSAGSHASVWSSVRQSAMEVLLRHPSHSSPASAAAHFFRSPAYLWMWGTYAATYAAANTLRTLTMEPPSSRAAPTADTPPVSTASSNNNSNHSSSNHKGSSGTMLFVGTAVVNSAASLGKDRAYARLYGSAAAAAASAVPAAAYGAWMCRDLTVIGAAFVLPTHVAGLLHERCAVPQRDATRLAQLVTPVAAQLVAGPLHLLGLDCVNRPPVASSSWAASFAERGRALRAGWVEVVAARMVRILPGYGIAGVLNTELRCQWRERVVVGCATLHRHRTRSSSLSAPRAWDTRVAR